MNRCILFFVKYPEPGQVKTRLAESTSPEQACELYKAFVTDMLPVLEDVEGAEVMVCYAPEGKGREMTQWLGRQRRCLSQKGADIGRRMENAFREAFFMFYDQVVLVGSDIPELSAEVVQQAFDGLDKGRAALGPARDGGYYLIGFQRGAFVPEVFSDMVWSTGQVFEDTVQRLVGSGMAVEVLPEMADMDTLEDVRDLVDRGVPEGSLTLELAQKIVNG
ncbi:TIGR04282 family arsenosugar biosynthesis glycosyltransferase [Salidesulfovibrio onnuriiensis]|uniref:TIGR04282 family arsenosugar biosynthesis glycosyltransferase n=1 Tax=Salidesulfovibrio onnuriiensis TaxID=2583823 RepID=UPI0011CB164C|nr:TIGR04282 family arsenosugar biosynthesis glycosyltransferase [Salidesulfovibrio onnuriiensis]